MRPLRSICVFFLSSSVLLCAPGPQAWAAAARALNAPVLAARTLLAPSLPCLGEAPGLAATRLSSPGVAALAAAVPSAATPAAAPERRLAALESLSRDLPDLSREEAGSSKASASADFTARLGGREARGREAAVGVPGAAQSHVSGLRPAPAAGAPHPALAARPAASANRAAALPAKIGGGASAAAAMFAFGGFAGLSGGLMSLVLFAVLIVPSMILHEMGHAKAAELLGDSGPRQEGRLSFKPRDLLTHIDPMMTVVVPLLSVFLGGFVFGGARPVRFRDVSARHTAIIAAAGPAVNFALALAGGLAFTALAGAGLPLLAKAAAMLVTYNVMLGLFNLLPLFPLDGHHLLRYGLTKTLGVEAAQRMDSVWDRLAASGMSMMAVLLVSFVLSPYLMAATSALTGFFLTLFGGA